jgi:hypothetical protein
LVGYSRIFRQRVRRGDIVAFEHPSAWEEVHLCQG